ncbi:PIN-like domain-containing protein [Brevibacillus brevis]|uniref:PIN-like domain-containing protein n=1 Tax=Brevibacillus brevis TaxID=1393 RepID=UPI0037C7E828
MFGNGLHFSVAKVCTFILPNTVLEEQMRSQFSYFFRQNPDNVKKMWEECIFVFDTNVLLDLYRYTHDTRETLLSMFKYFADRIWIPHQVGLEFFKNRPSVIIEQKEAYKSIATIIDDFGNRSVEDLEGKLKKYKRHPTIEINKKLQKIKQEFESIVAEIREQEEKHPDLQENDFIYAKLERLFEKKVGEPFTQEELNKIYKEGEIRYNNNYPPGYEDSKEKKSVITNFENLSINDKFGDLIIWKQIIQMAIVQKRPVVFVTGDAKEDWFEKIRGKTQGPRLELLYEFKKETDCDFFMYHTDRFMKYAQTLVKPGIDEGAIQEISDVRKVTEKKSKPFLEESLRALLDDILNSELNSSEINKQYNDSMEWHPGDIVRHPKWGDGIILRVMHVENQTELRVGFLEPIGVQTLLARYAQLERVSLHRS